MFSQIHRRSKARGSTFLPAKRRNSTLQRLWLPYRVRQKNVRADLFQLWKIGGSSKRGATIRGYPTEKKNISQPQDKPQTRRGLLSVFCSVYDPLRFAAPVILPARLMLQYLCRKKNRGLDDPDFLWSHKSTWPVQLETMGQVTKDDPEINSEV